MADAIVSSVGYLIQRITDGEHALIADEPLAAGGSNAGPDPYSLLLGALGACTAMTLQIYARRKEWPLEQVEVSLKHSRIHAGDCDDCVATSGKIERIERYISLSGKLNEEQRARLLDIAERCPVHKTLASGVSIKSYLE